MRRTRTTILLSSSSRRSSSSSVILCILQCLLLLFTICNSSNVISSVSGAATTTTTATNNKKNNNNNSYYQRLLSSIFTSKDNSEIQTRIHGGWDTVEDRYSYAQVSLATHADGHQCGGSMIAVDVVLTAAHCAGSYDIIVVGKHNIYDATDESETFGALKEIVHPNYDEETTRFDVMIIILDGWSTLAQPVRVNEDPNVPFNGQTVTVMGWGYDANWELTGSITRS